MVISFRTAAKIQKRPDAKKASAVCGRFARPPFNRFFATSVPTSQESFRTVSPIRSTGCCFHECGICIVARIRMRIVARITFPHVFLIFPHSLSRALPSPTILLPIHPFCSSSSFPMPRPAPFLIAVFPIFPHSTSTKATSNFSGT